VEVEVDQADAVGGLGVPRDGADPHRAVAAQDQADLAGEDRLAHPRGGVVDDLDDLAQVLSPRACAIGAPAPGFAIAVVAHLDAAVA
jgi:hypothetical protein